MKKLEVHDLYRECSLDLFNFNTTDELQDFKETIGQERAIRSLDFGLSLDSTGFNIFILGEHGTGKMTTVRSFLYQKALGEPVPSDWCYVYNFTDPDSPLAIELEPGYAVIFQKDMDDFTKVLKQEIVKAFDSENYEREKSEIVKEFQNKRIDDKIPGNSQSSNELQVWPRNRGFEDKKGSFHSVESTEPFQTSHSKKPGKT